MKLTNEFDAIRRWASKRRLYLSGNPQIQTLKLVEEIGELSKAIIESDDEGVIDALGDCVIVMVSLAYFKGTSLENCINKAYNQIKDRERWYIY